MNEKTLKDLLSSLKETGKPKTSAYDTTATVTRVEGGTAWVHIPGGVTETPVKLTINAKAGDNVQVRVSGGRAFMVGNATAPPTDDHTARQALAETRTVSKVVKAVREIAEKASKIAGNTNQYFWHTETGTDTGAHITEVPQEEFLADPANGGGNTLIRSNGVAVRDGLTELATFSADGAQLGQDSETHADIDYHSLELVDKEGSTYFHVSDLRTRGSDEVTVTEDFVGDGSTQDFVLGANTTTVTSCEIDGATVSPSGYSVVGSNILHFNTAPASWSHIVVSYLGTGSTLKAYTFGKRDSGSAVAPMSYVVGKGRATATYSYAEGYGSRAQGRAAHAEGNASIASGISAHAEGRLSQALDLACHAEGQSIATAPFAHAEGYQTIASEANAHSQNNNTVADNPDQTAIGRWNTRNNSNNLFAVGNGTGEASRSDAFTVDASGNVEASGKLTANTVQSYTPTYNESVATANCSCTVSAGMCSFIYRGANVAHSTSTVLCMLPVGARPTKELHIGFVKNSGVAIGTVTIGTNGEVTVATISSSTATGRIYFNCTYPVV